jgi:hypothetical protein
MLCDFQIGSDAMGVLFTLTWTIEPWSPPVATTDNYGNPMWRYPSQTFDLGPFPPVSMTVVAGISSFSAAYMAYVGFTEYELADGSVIATASDTPFLFPQGEPLFMPSLSPLIAGNIIWFSGAYGLIPAGVRITDQPAGMSSPSSGLTVTIVGYD